MKKIDKKLNCGIYKIENMINGRLYIGSSNQLRRRFYLHKWDLRRGKHHSITLQRSWDKYGEGAFQFTILLYCTVVMLRFYEQRGIDSLDTVNPAKGFNICCDASSAGTGRVWTDEQKRAKSIERKGKKVTPKTLKHLIASRKRGPDHPMFGKHHTKESRKKISEALKGRKVWNKGKHTNNNQAKITPAQVLEIRKQFLNLKNYKKELSAKYGLKPDTICKICSGILWPNVGGL